MLELVIGATAVTAGAAAWARRRRSRARFEIGVENVRRLRAHADRVAKLVRLDMQQHAGDRALRIRVDGLAEPTRELQPLGMTVLGDTVSESVDGLHPSRWFVDADRTTLLVFTRIAGERHVTVRSHDAERAFITRRSSIPRTAVPASIVRQAAPIAATLAAIVASHRTLVAGATGLVRITDLDHAIREVARVHVLATAWRQTVPEPELLDHDLRLILGNHYPRMGARMARALHTRLPPARLV